MLDKSTIKSQEKLKLNVKVSQMIFYYEYKHTLIDNIGFYKLMSEQMI